MDKGGDEEDESELEVVEGLGDVERVTSQP